jgi:4-amino-4-deoxy-L-arabinose transferase-like glycosyltransferase
MRTSSSIEQRVAMRLPRRSLLFFGVLSWALIVVGFYYRQLWTLLISGGWDRPHLFLDLRLPYFGSAVWHALISVGGAAPLTLAAGLVGLAICRALGWQFSTQREAIPFWVALGIGSYAYAGWALALLGFYLPPVLLVLALVPLGLGLIAWVRQGRPLPPRPALSPLVRNPWAWISAAAMGSALIAAIAPDIEYDALWYHLTYPQRYLAAGYLVDLRHDYVSLYPMTWELWFGYGLVFGGQSAATLLHFACLPLIALALHGFAEQHLGRQGAWIAVAIFSTIPTVLWEASTAYIDLALAFHLLLMFLALVRYVATPTPQWLALAIINMGVALATKHLALFALAIACVGLLYVNWRRSGDLRTALIAPVLLGGFALLFPLPWYLRSWLAIGNPVFPELYGLFGAPPERWNAEAQAGLKQFLAQFGPEPTVWGILSLPWHMTMHAAVYHGVLGPIFLLVLPILVLIRMRPVLAAASSFVALFVLLWASPFSSFQMRFLIAISPFFAFVAAAAAVRLIALSRQSAGRTAQRLISASLVGLLLLNLPIFTALHQGDWDGEQGWLVSILHGLPISVVIGGESHTAYLSRNVASYRVWQAAQAVLQPGDRVLTWSGGDHFLTPQVDRIWVYAPEMFVITSPPQGAEAAVLAQLRTAGITHLIVDQRPTSGDNGWDAFAVTGQIARQTWYEQIYSDNRYVLFRLRDEQK